MKELEKELLKYPEIWRGLLKESALKGESVSEAYNQLKDFEYLM